MVSPAASLPAAGLPMVARSAVRRLSLRLAQALLNQRRVQVAVGTLLQLSILEGEAGGAARLEARTLNERFTRIQLLPALDLQGACRPQQPGSGAGKRLQHLHSG